MSYDPILPEHLDTLRTRRREPVSWPVVVGFGALALLWPLVDALGVADALGQPATALAVLAIVGLAWVLGAGFGRVPRPILTLTLAGVVYGVILVALSLLLDVRPAFDGRLGAAVAVVEIARSAGLGALAGLLAAALQRTLAAR